MPAALGPEVLPLARRHRQQTPQKAGSPPLPRPFRAVAGRRRWAVALPLHPRARAHRRPGVIRLAAVAAVAGAEPVGAAPAVERRRPAQWEVTAGRTARRIR